MPTPADEAKMVEQMIVDLESREMDETQKAQFRQALEQLAADIRSGRRRLGDAD